MSSDPQTPSSDSGQPAGTDPEQPQVSLPRRRRRHPLLRTLGVLVALVVALIVATLPIDLGPALRKRAETAGSKYIERPMHIGTLKVKLLTGQFVVENLVIEGLNPGDRPFLTAKRVAVNMPWWSIFHRELIISDVDMSDWNMLIEQFKDGRHNFPKFVHPKPPNQKPGRKLFTTTVGYVIARNGQFTYEDHGTPWSVVCRNLTVTVFKAIDTYRGTAQFTNGTVAIQSYLPFRTDMQTRFKIDGGKVLLDRIDIETPGATAAVNGAVDLGHWPEMFYNVKSHVDFPTEKNIFFHDMKFTTAGQGDFTGTFHFFKGGRELKGTFTSPEAGVDAWRFSNVAGSLLWVPDRFEVSDVTMSLYGGRAKMLYSIGPFGKPTPASDVWDATYSDVDLTRLTDFLELKGIRLAGRISGRNRLVWPSGKFSQKRGTGEVTAVMPSGVTPLTREPPPGIIARVDPLPPEEGPFNAHLPIGHVP
ncbi:MAG TPA: hypothetical protein VG871_11065, partial [Vicinamibacterales bacterium]|nr:hypothetical protein [Vicinamibacterales bacterium]